MKGRRVERRMEGRRVEGRRVEGRGMEGRRMEGKRMEGRIPVLNALEAFTVKETHMDKIPQ